MLTAPLENIVLVVTVKGKRTGPPSRERGSVGQARLRAIGEVMAELKCWPGK